MRISTINIPTINIYIIASPTYYIINIKQYIPQTAYVKTLKDDARQLYYKIKSYIK